MTSLERENKSDLFNGWRMGEGMKGWNTYLQYYKCSCLVSSAKKFRVICTNPASGEYYRSNFRSFGARKRNRQGTSNTSNTSNAYTRRSTTVGIKEKTRRTANPTFKKFSLSSERAREPSLGPRGEGGIFDDWGEGIVYGPFKRRDAKNANDKWPPPLHPV